MSIFLSPDRKFRQTKISVNLITDTKLKKIVNYSICVMFSLKIFNLRNIYLKVLARGGC